ncbi:Intraflagellar transport protein [Phytophthora fragariae]|uniref:Intraflagellar transport protein n=1 Tax=Phytophthora fragariae TaxID=53985 RepID=A0A6G0REY9_9STRA|nr:Intraflagellar transport protein [Phytophthora fragariae]
MALFYDYNVAVPANLRQVCSVWGELDPVLAVALENREIHFFTDEGEKQQGLENYSRSADIVTMAWQPRGGALAVGWSDGMVSLWVFKEQTAREVNSPHTSRVCLLKWAPAGNRLMSADENGVFAVWKVDSRCQLTLSTQYARQGSFTHCVFATLPAGSRDSNAKSDHFSQHACPQFFFGGEVGSVHRADDLGHITDVQVLNHAIDSMMFYEEQSRLIVITRAVQLFVYQVGTTDGTVKLTTKVKLSLAGEGSLLETKWAGPGLLAIASGEAIVRFWNIRTEENSVLSLPKSSGLNYNVNNLSFSPRRRVLVAGTAQGAVFFWRATSFVDSTQGNGETPAVSYRWDLLFTADVERAVTRIGWSNANPALYANTVEGVVILHEGNMQRALCGDTAVIQVRPKTLSIEKFLDGAQSGVTITQATLEASLRIKGISHDGSTLVVWNGSKAEVYEMKDGDTKITNQFKCFSSAMVLRGESIYRANGNHVEICNLAGVVKNSISFTEAEGRPAMLSLQNKFLAVGTDRGLLRVFDVSRRDPKALGSMGNLPEAYGDETKSAVMRSICVNSDGTRICILADRVEGALRMREPLSKLFLFQTDLNIYQQFDFGASQYPNSGFFDPQEPRLLICETAKTGNNISTLGTSGGAAGSRRDPSPDDGLGAGGASGSRGNLVSDKEVTIIFASNEHGLLMQDSFDLDLKYTALLGIQVPRVYFVARIDNGSSDDSTTVVHVGRTKANNPVTKTPMIYDTASYLRTQIMRDFTGLDKVNNEAKQALIDFCYFMTVGNMDEAYRSVKLIENPSVWENMARMCVKTKRLDVAEVCLGNMGHARGAAAVQEAKKEPELEVAIAMVAIQLGLRDDAARLYRECGRFDLLNKLYQASGYWKKAVDVASKRDRIHLKATYHALARHYEEMGDLKEAMEAYEDAGTHQKDIPRMLIKLGKIDLLQKYVSTSNNRDLLIWWAQFQESQGQFDGAVESYQRAKDYLSIVRVLCFKKDFQAAAKVAQTSGNRAAAYHLARQFEAHNEISNAIHFFASGGCYNHAIRLAKEHRMDTDLMGFALMSKPSDMLDCAAYFEEQREMEKAVQLYHKGGNVAKALDLCFQAQLFEELHHLTDELSGSGTTSPAILKKCADFFISNGHYAKAVHLCLIGNRVAEALDVCMQHDVKVTEEMAEKMTPPKSDDTASPADKKNRTELLLKLAKCCKQQGSYHLATKKYTQAGNKLKAMKCLLKSGDTEKVVFFANVSRNAQIFVLAANYLQNLDWRKDTEIMKNIVGFYTKARAFEQLAAFYAGCAQVEIEEYRDYEKAISALQEAMQVVSKSRADGKDALLKRYEKRVLLIEQFVIARQQAKHSPKEMMDIVTKLLEEPGIEEAIRVGDAYAMLTEAYYEEGELNKSFETMEEMKRRGLTLKSYVDTRVVEAVQAKLGVSLGDDRRRRPSPSDNKQAAPSSRPSSREAKSSSRPSSREDQSSRPGSREADIRPGSREAPTGMSRPNSREDKMARPDDEEVEDEMEEDIAEDE